MYQALKVKTTAFVSHYDCSRHDTGWGHLDHQGRLPALSRAVYRDMLDLFDPLLEVEGRHASIEEVKLVHSSEYLARVQSWVAEAAEVGRVIEPQPELRISGATWEASTAAVGCALSAIDAVLDGRVSNAFAASRPPGSDAGVGRAGRFGVLNPVAVAARYLEISCGAAPVLVVDWGGAGESALRRIFEESDSIDVISPAAEEGEGDRYFDRLHTKIDHHLGRRKPAFFLLSADFSGLATDPLGPLALDPREYHPATVRLRQMAERTCEGRLVSILGGGYDPQGLGRATVEHLRGLSGLPATVS